MAVIWARHKQDNKIVSGLNVQLYMIHCTLLRQSDRWGTLSQFGLTKKPELASLQESVTKHSPQTQ